MSRKTDFIFRFGPRESVVEVLNALIPGGGGGEVGQGQNAQDPNARKSHDAV